MSRYTTKDIRGYLKHVKHIGNIEGENPIPTFWFTVGHVESLLEHIDNLSGVISELKTDLKTPKSMIKFQKIFYSWEIGEYLGAMGAFKFVLSGKQLQPTSKGYHSFYMKHGLLYGKTFAKEDERVEYDRNAFHATMEMVLGETRPKEDFYTSEEDFYTLDNEQ